MLWVVRLALSYVHLSPFCYAAPQHCTRALRGQNQQARCVDFGWFSCLVSATFYDSENQGSRRAIVLTRSAKCDRVYAAHAGLAMYVFTVCLAHSNP